MWWSMLARSVRWRTGSALRWHDHTSTWSTDTSWDQDLSSPSSNAWFDDECRQAKRLLRTQDRVARRSGSLSDLSSPAVLTWRLQRRQYFSLLRDEKTSFWTALVNADQQHPGRIWQSYDQQLLGRGRAPPTDISAPVLHKFFDDKIASVIVLPLTTLLNRCSRLHHLAASSVYSLQSHRQMWFRWFERFQTSSARLIRYRHGF